jgi:hypothetical protein
MSIENNSSHGMDELLVAMRQIHHLRKRGASIKDAVHLTTDEMFPEDQTTRTRNRSQLIREMIFGSLEEPDFPSM